MSDPRHGQVQVTAWELLEAAGDEDAYLIATKLAQTELDECGPECDADCFCDEEES